MFTSSIACTQRQKSQCANRRSRPFLSVELCKMSRPTRRDRAGFLYFCDWQYAVDEKYTEEIQRRIHRINDRETGLRMLHLAQYDWCHCGSTVSSRYMFVQCQCYLMLGIWNNRPPLHWNSYHIITYGTKTELNNAKTIWMCFKVMIMVDAT